MNEPSKKELRAQIRREMKEYVERGGKVDTVERGASGRDPADGPLRHVRAYDARPKAERTPVPEVVAAIERRRLEARKPRAKAKKAAKGRRGPRRRLVYDEFGEPLRYTWVDD